MYILQKELTIFGSKGDIQPMSLTVVRDHCQIKFDGSAVFVIAGKGDTWHNGRRVPEGTEEKVEIFDRIAMGDQVPPRYMLFRAVACCYCHFVFGSGAK